MTTTLEKSVQQVAYNDIVNNGDGANVGAAVALNPTTGAILAIVSTPSFDPTKLVSHDTNQARRTYNKLNKQSPNPLAEPGDAGDLPAGLDVQGDHVGGWRCRPASTPRTRWCRPARRLRRCRAAASR